LAVRGNVEREEARDFPTRINVRSRKLPNNGSPINRRSLIALQQSFD
jgi:hypothetical protein